MRRFRVASILLVCLVVLAYSSAIADNAPAQSEKLPDRLNDLTDLRKLKEAKELSMLQRTNILISWFKQEKDNPTKPFKAWSGGGYINSGYIQKQILWMLGDEGDPVEIDRKIRQDKAADNIKDEIGVSLGLMGDERQVSVILKVLRKHKEPYVRTLAARALAVLGAVEAKPALEELLDDEFSVIVHPDVGAVRRETIYPVREAATEALRILAMPEQVKAAKERNKAFADKLKAANIVPSLAANRECPDNTPGDAEK